MDHVVEDEVEAAGHAGGDEPVELDDIGVVEAAQDEDLARHEPHALGLQVVEAHLLERHDLAADRVPRFVHIAVRALADLRAREGDRVRERLKKCKKISPRRSRYTDHGGREAEERAHLVDLLEGVGAARGPAIDGLAGDGGEPGGPAGGDLLAARLVGEAPAQAHLGVRRRRRCGARRPRPPLPLDLLGLLGRLLLRRRGGGGGGGVGGIDPFLLRLGDRGMVPAAGGGGGGSGTGGGGAAVHAAHGRPVGALVTGGRAWAGTGARSFGAGGRGREAAIRRRRRGEAGGRVGSGRRGWRWWWWGRVK